MPESFASQQHFRNRTDDFRKKMTSAGGWGADGDESTQLIPSKKPPSLFLQTAQQISKQIHSAGIKLKKLSSLVQKKSLFDDPASEINELTFVIKKDIKILQSTLEELNKIYGKKKSTQSHSHKAGVVGCLERDIEKIVKVFFKILEKRSQNIQEQQKSRQTLVGKTSTARNPMLYSSNFFEEAQNGDEISLDMEMESEQMMEFANGESYDHQASQLTELERVNRSLVSLHEIFIQVGNLLMDHDQSIGRLDQNIQNAQENSDEGRRIIEDFWRNLSSGRGLYAKIFAVLIAFIFLWIVFFV